LIRFATVLGALALAVTSGIMACGESLVSIVTPRDSAVHSVTVFPPGPVNLRIGDKMTFSASLLGGPGLSDRRVTWSSANARIATVDQNGVVTADSAGTTSITATSRADTAVSGAAVVTVAAAASAGADR
jgi:uncharacterized protein YjdB